MRGKNREAVGSRTQKGNNVHQKIKLLTTESYLDYAAARLETQVPKMELRGWALPFYKNL